MAIEFQDDFEALTGVGDDPVTDVPLFADGGRHGDHHLSSARACGPLGELAHYDETDLAVMGHPPSGTSGARAPR